MKPAKALAAELVVAVHDSDRATCHRVLSEATRDELYGLVVCLAASVRPDDPLLAHWKPPLVPFDEIVAATCEVMGVYEHEFYSKTLDETGKRARHVAAWVGAAAGYPYVKLGAKMSRNHSTISHSIDRVTREPGLHRLAVRVVEKIGPERIQEANGEHK